MWLSVLAGRGYMMIGCIEEIQILWMRAFSWMTVRLRVKGLRSLTKFHDETQL